MELSKLLDLIPPEELKLKLSYGSTELDPTFLCFEHVYLPVSKMIPEHFTIVDLGCFQAAQAYLFRNHGIQWTRVYPAAEISAKERNSACDEH